MCVCMCVCGREGMKTRTAEGRREREERSCVPVGASVRTVRATTVHTRTHTHTRTHAHRRTARARVRPNLLCASPTSLASFKLNTFFGRVVRGWPFTPLAQTVRRGDATHINTRGQQDCGRKGTPGRKRREESECARNGNRKQKKKMEWRVGVFVCVGLGGRSSRPFSACPRFSSSSKQKGLTRKARRSSGKRGG